MAHIWPSSKIPLTLAALIVSSCAGLRAQCPLPGSDGTSKLLSFTGQISVMRGSYAWALNVCDAVKPQEVVVTGPDGWGLFQVADGSKFEVYPNSRVVFRANQGNWTDLLELWLGKVRVQIEHFGGLPNNNKVRTPTAVISVRGTIFDVEIEPDNDATLVQDEDGVVVVDHLLRPSEKVLHAGEYVRVYRNEPLAKAAIDKGGVMQRLALAARDAFYQAAINRSNGIGRIPTSTPGSPADKNGGGAAPAPPPPPAPAPPPPPPH
ncbi:MAG: FecR domain-containing protein [Acidobacteriota bacterium]|nr:FecR domain-containing protein [Acidobacteriota bacterium]